GSAWLGSWGASTTAFKELVGDFNGDGKSDVGLYEGAYGKWYIAPSTGSAFSPASGGADCWLTNWGTSTTAYRPLDPSTQFAIAATSEGVEQPLALSVSAMPNPFRPTTAIRYTLPQSARVELAVFDVRGRKIATLVRGEQSAGIHSITWHSHA